MVQPSCFASSALHLPTMCLIKLQEGEEESEEEEAEPEEAPKPAPAPPPARAAPRSRGAKGRRQTPRDQEDIDEILRELPQAAGEERSIGEEAGPSDGRPLKQAQRPLLAVSARHLKASEELKRMFGSDAIEEDDEAGAAYAGGLWCLFAVLGAGLPMPERQLDALMLASFIGFCGVARKPYTILLNVLWSQGTVAGSGAWRPGECCRCHVSKRAPSLTPARIGPRLTAASPWRFRAVLALGSRLPTSTLRPTRWEGGATQGLWGLGSLLRRMWRMSCRCGDVHYECNACHLSQTLDEMFDEGGAAYDPQEAAAILQVRNWWF